MFWEPSTVGSRFITIDDSALGPIAVDTTNGVQGIGTTQGTSLVIALLPGEVITLSAAQTSGGNLNLSGGGVNARLSLAWVGPD